ncbi:hypothetical protein ALC53_12863 [Atta colombica]|uniref:Uncharacterized protein n=1 Tax=Atta colombica TaxID=520822 RepID=A0A151HYF0_9HYME|nr:hypothetical protein ALC53_12863 [Atta colombica]
MDMDYENVSRKRSRQCEGDEENQRADDSRQEMRERAHGGAFLNQIIGQNSGNNTASASQLIVQILTCYDTVCVILAHTQCTYIQTIEKIHYMLPSSVALLQNPTFLMFKKSIRSTGARFSLRLIRPRRLTGS